MQNTEYQYKKLLAFSCKARRFCPSCQAKRQVEFSAFLTQGVLEPVARRQAVLYIPRRLRPFFMRGRRLLAKMARCGYDTVRDPIREALDCHDAVPAAAHTRGGTRDAGAAWNPSDASEIEVEGTDR